MTRPRAALLALGLALAGARAWGEDLPGLPAAKLQAVEAAISREMARRSIPGLTAAVVVGGQLRWISAFGLADLEQSVPAKPETVFRIASLSKAITATAVMQLAERGKLDLDAPIQRYVPAFPEKPWPVTPRQLLAHLGGVRHLRDDEWGSTKHYTSLSDALETFKDDPLVHPPGTKALYSTFGYCLLGCAVEAASGMKFADYVRENVFEPAGMDHTRTDDAYEIIPNRAPGYARTAAGTLRNSILADTSNKIPGGGLCAPAADVARFALALQAGALVRKETLAAMLERQRTRDGRHVEYGLGWLVARRKGRLEAWHHGGQPQVSAMLYMNPDQGLAVVFLTNLEGVAPDLLELARQVAEVVSR